jgi:beta-phosphoglucomutase-like phosphatase (HAD superfamily)
MIKAIIFDVDDTLLDNLPNSEEGGLHERSRLLAVHTIGREQKIENLLNVTTEDNLQAFLTANVHTLDAAVWNLLQMKGVVPIGPIDSKNELLIEIVRLKNELHEKILAEFGVEVSGATKFLEFLETIKLSDKLAIGSSAVRRDILLFIEKMNWEKYFPDGRIVSVENVKYPKPNPEVFMKAFKSIGISDDQTKQTLVLEDDPRGVVAGKAANMQVCAITTRYSRDYFSKLDIAPDFIIDNYKEAEDIFKYD